jgi:hypothetical protein
MKIKMTTAFRALNAARAASAAGANRYIVKSINKNSAVSRMAPTAWDWKLNAFVTADAAEVRRGELERMNPGSRFAVVPV